MLSGRRRVVPAADDKRGTSAVGDGAGDGGLGGVGVGAGSLRLRRWSRRAYDSGRASAARLRGVDVIL